MEDVSPEEDAIDKNFTKLINDLVNRSLANGTDVMDLYNRTQATNTTTLLPGTLDEDSVAGGEEVGVQPNGDKEVIDEKDVENEVTLEDVDSATTTTITPPVSTSTPRSTVEHDSCGPSEDVFCKPVPCESVPCQPVPCVPGLCKPVPCLSVPCQSVPCQPVKPVGCTPCCPTLPCKPVPCLPVGCTPALGGEEVATPISVPVAMAVGATVSLLAVGLVAGIGFIIRYLPVYLSGTLFVGSIVLTFYLSSRYPATARELGVRALGLVREATANIMDRVTHALTRQEQQVSPHLV